MTKQEEWLKETKELHAAWRRVKDAEEAEKMCRKAIRYRSHRLYATAWWKRTRTEWLQETPWCERCLMWGRHVKATQVHHINPHDGIAQWFYTTFLESLCASCHSKATAEERAERTEQRWWK